MTDASNYPGGAHNNLEGKKFSNEKNPYLKEHFVRGPIGYVSGMIADGKDIVVTGGTYPPGSNSLFCKLNGNGTYLWNKQLPDSLSCGVILKYRNEYVLVGNTSNNPFAGGGNLFFIKADKDGNIVK